MGEVLHLDFETRSEADLTEVGADVYAMHPTTEVIACGYAFDEGEIQVDGFRQAVDFGIIEHVESGKKVIAHNAAFEFLIWNNCFRHKDVGISQLKIEQMECTMAMSYAMALPGKLQKVALALGITDQKDMKGHRIMLQLSQPRSRIPTVWWEDEEKYAKLYDYCRQDVKVEREVYKRVLQLAQKERDLWLLDQKINRKGIFVSLPAITKAIEIVDQEKARFDKEIKEVTENYVSTCTENRRFTDWILSQGVKTEGVAKANVTHMLGKKTLPQNVRKALELRQEAAKSSNAKLLSMKNRVCDDGRLRGLFQYHGAGTGRWAGRGVQVHNFPRPTLKQSEINEIFEILKTPNAKEQILTIYGSPNMLISDCLRGFLIPQDGNEFLAADFSAIEARVLAWLAGQEDVLDIFRDHGKIYEFAATQIYDVSLDKVTEAQRQIGKVAVLALGYGGGKFAFQIMAKNYQVDVSEQKAESIKRAWRESNYKITQYWYDLEEAVKTALTRVHPVSVENQGVKIQYKQKGSFLFCQLPSGRVITYPYPKLQEVTTPWGAKKEAMTYMSEDALTKKWERQVSYGGLLAENITQAVARDVLSEAMLGLSQSDDAPIVLHVHDEIVCEVPIGSKSLVSFTAQVEQLPNWATDLPIKVKGWQGTRYQK